MNENDIQQSQKQDIKYLFRNTLNRHGHPFQFAVIRRAHDLRDENRSYWNFEVSEFPVEVQGYNTRIDFILSQRNHAPYRLLVAECKRANPSLSNWLFAKAPYVRRGEPPRLVLLEKMRRDDRDVFAGVGQLDYPQDIYHVALEAKGREKGDAHGAGRGAIEEAATQVIRGVNGLIDCLSKQLRFLPNSTTVSFVPAIFTTARIYVTNADLGNTNLVNGELAATDLDVSEAPWMWLQYHISPSLKHSVNQWISDDDKLIGDKLWHLLKAEYARTIAIVGPNGIDAFLGSHIWEM